MSAKRTAVAIHVSNKIGFVSEIVTLKRQRGTLYCKKKVNSHKKITILTI